MQLVSVKVIRNKITGQPEGYGFIEFISHAAAERTLQTYNGTQMPGTELTFRLNWASFGSGQKVDSGPDHSIFVGDLAPDVTDYLLQETFRVHYSSVRGAKVVTDPSTGRSKGYGFVKFAEESERNRAMAEMNGLYCSTRPMRISAATPKKNVGVQQQYVTKGMRTKHDTWFMLIEFCFSPSYILFGNNLLNWEFFSSCLPSSSCSCCTSPSIHCSIWTGAST